jgi:hypothetical protein
MLPGAVAAQPQRASPTPDLESAARSPQARRLLLTRPALHLVLLLMMVLLLLLLQDQFPAVLHAVHDQRGVPEQARSAEGLCRQAQGAPRRARPASTPPSPCLPGLRG